MKRYRLLPRTLAVLLCAALLAVSVPLATFAEEDTDAAVVQITEEQAVAPEALEDLSTEEQAVAPEALDDLSTNVPADANAPWYSQALTFIFQWVGWLGYHYEPNGNYVYNVKYAQQWVGGFNQLWDAFSWVAFVFADSLKINFTYEGKDWLIQLWKGAYAVAFAAGGEVGVYNKPEGSDVNHYFSATTDDFLNIGFTVYHDNAKVLTRAPEKHWWCTGYAPALVTDFLSKPRRSVVLDASIELKDAEMAALFVEQLEGKGFAPWDGEGTFGLRTPETYILSEDGKTVRLLWKTASESWY
ncbi:MAG: DUF4474 domain-containing protein [Oscillospiraceae bacterium]|jgi:hypothetical protein|nr:DUF4474 domain-containing protein [Oscillospiraceae bacterium]